VVCCFPTDIGDSADCRNKFITFIKVIAHILYQRIVTESVSFSSLQFLDCFGFALTMTGGAWLDCCNNS
jgi:hypothetical protein